MKKLTAFAATVLLSSSAFAGTHTAHNHNNIRTDTFTSKAQAYEAGYDLADQINDMSQAQLRRNLHFYGDSSVRNIKVKDTTITVEEFSKSRGEIAYRAIVDVDYQYKAHESDND